MTAGRPRCAFCPDRPGPAESFLRFWSEAGPLRPACRGCAADYVQTLDPGDVAIVPFDEGFSEYLVQGVMDS